jgi:hypothetical protein
MNTTTDRVDLVRAKPYGLARKIASLLLIYLLLALVSNVAWRLLHLPPQMHYGILNPPLMLVSGVILLGAILIASAWTVRSLDHRPLSTVGIPLSGPWLRQSLIGLLAGFHPADYVFSGGLQIGQRRSDAHAT